MDFDNKKVLGVHIEGEKKFSMYKQWGEDDERILPIYSEYANTIIRWGKQEVEEAVINKNKRDNARELRFVVWQRLGKVKSYSILCSKA